MTPVAYRATATEAEFQALVVDTAETLGWLTVHFRQMVGNPAGFPDLLLIRGRTTMYVELKREGGTVSRRQAEWIGQLEAVGADVRVWYPTMWSEILAVLSEGANECAQIVPLPDVPGRAGGDLGADRAPGS